MKKFFILIFTICISTSLPAEAQPTTPKAPTPAPPTAAMQKKLDAFWKTYEQVYGLGIITVKGYRMKTKNDKFVAKLDDPQTQERALAELGKVFGKRVNETFTEVEIDYLIQLFSSPIAKKLFQLEGKFWVPTVTTPIIRSVTNPTEPAPSPPLKK